MPLKVRRGTNALRQTIVPEQGELIYTTDTKKLYVGDGINAGGYPVTGDPFLGLSNVVEDLTPQLGGNLDLNTRDITGTGNINIAGRITTNELFVQPNGLVSTIIPKTNNTYSLGNAQRRFKNIYTNDINIDGTFSAAGINSDIVADDSTVLVDVATGRLLTSSLTQSGATNGQVLKWNGNTNTWSPSDNTLNNLDDTNIVGQVDGDVLTWDNDNSQWIASASAGGGGGATSLNDLTDVNATPTDGNALIWNNALSTWEEGNPLLPLTALDFVLTPALDDTTDIGTDALRFRKIHMHSLTTNVVDSALIPTASGTYSLGTSAKRWTKVWADDLSIANTISMDIIGSTFGEDSTLFTDSVTRDINANNIIANELQGNVIGNTSGQHIGPVTGDVVGSVFGDDSAILVDAVDGLIVGNIENDITKSRELRGVSAGTYNIAYLLRQETGAVAPDTELSKINFGTEINNITSNAWTISARQDFLTFFPHPDTPDFTQFVKIWQNGKVMIQGEAGVSGFDGLAREPDADLEVVGNVKISGPNELLLGSMTTAQRDALTAVNGMIIYNNTLNKFQGYENGAWVNLI